MKLYYSPGACSLAPHITLEEIGKPYSIELVSSMDGSTKTERYLKINPKGRVPALDIGNTVITEVSAILTYLALTNPECSLIENSPLELARSIEWMNWLASGVHALAVAQNWRAERFSDDKSCYQSIQAKGMDNLKSAYLEIEKRLADTEWAVGQAFTIVDPYVFVFYRWGNRLGVSMKEVFPHWTEHTMRMLDRKSVKVVLETEKISVWE